MPNIAYFDCFSGCSGDMVLGALLDAGLSLEALTAGLHNLNLQGYRLSSEKVVRSSIAATKFNVIIDPSVQQPHRSLSDILKMIVSSKLSDRVKENSRAKDARQESPLLEGWFGQGSLDRDAVVTGGDPVLV